MSEVDDQPVMVRVPPALAVHAFSAKVNATSAYDAHNSARAVRPIAVIAGRYQTLVESLLPCINCPVIALSPVFTSTLSKIIICDP